MRYVLDSNVALKWFLPEESSDLARGLLSRARDGSVSLIAPEVFLAEVAHSLRREVVRKHLPIEEARSIWQDIRTVQIDLPPCRHARGRCLLSCAREHGRRLRCAVHSSRSSRGLEGRHGGRSHGERFRQGQPRRHPRQLGIGTSGSAARLLRSEGPHPALELFGRTPTRCPEGRLRRPSRRRSMRRLTPVLREARDQRRHRTRRHRLRRLCLRGRHRPERRGREHPREKEGCHPVKQRPALPIGPHRNQPTRRARTAATPPASGIRQYRPASGSMGPASSSRGYGGVRSSPSLATTVPVHRATRGPPACNRRPSGLDEADTGHEGIRLPSERLDLPHHLSRRHLPVVALRPDQMSMPVNCFPSPCQAAGYRSAASSRDSHTQPRSAA